MAARLVQRLGERRSAGSYLDHGTLTVAVTDAAAARTVRTAGITADRVRFSTAELNRVQAELDRYAQRHDVGQAQGWYVDVPDNQVQVTMASGAADTASRAFLKKLRLYGERVAIERTQGQTAQASLYGGYPVDARRICSVGFNARTSGGSYLFISAGHCMPGNPWWYFRGSYVGQVRGYSFPGNDYGAVTIQSPSTWNPQGRVYMYNGQARAVSGYSTASVGSTICKSGRTSGWTCGRILGYNETVVYGGGYVVYGLVRHNACVEPGDSGGPVLSGNYAQGTIAAAQFHWAGGRLVCGARVGRPNVAWYNPIGEALRAYGASLIR